MKAAAADDSARLARLSAGSEAEMWQRRIDRQIANGALGTNPGEVIFSLTWIRVIPQLVPGQPGMGAFVTPTVRDL